MATPESFPYACDICGKFFKALQGLVAHQFYAHGVSVKDFYAKHPEHGRSHGRSLFTEVHDHASDPMEPSIIEPSSSATEATPPSPPPLPPQPVRPPSIRREEGIVTTKVSEIELTPVSRPVKLNAIVFLYYDEMRKMGFDGDLGDFITECVVDYFRRTMKLRLGFFREAE